MAGIVEFEKHPSETLKVGKGFSWPTLTLTRPPATAATRPTARRSWRIWTASSHELQEKLFAESRFGGRKRILLVLQAMDTAGKGGIVNHVMATMDPQGVQFKAFKAPTDEEKSYDFLWRIEKAVPAAGMVGIFDRSHYEDVLIHRVHSWATPEEIKRRYRAINEFEARQTDAGTKIVKVMLNISKDEQKARLLARLDDPAKHWKYSSGDLKERAFWEDYMDAYQAAFDETSTDHAPGTWFRPTRNGMPGSRCSSWCWVRCRDEAGVAESGVRRRR